MSTALTDLDREIIDTVGQYVSSEDGFIKDVEFENNILAKIKNKVLHPKPLELLSARLKTNGATIAVGIAMIRAYKHHIETGNELAFQASVDCYNRFYAKSPEEAQRTLKNVQSEFLPVVLEKLKDPERLKMIVGEVQLNPADAAILLQTTEGMDDLIIDAIDFSKGLIDIRFRITLRNGEKLEIFDTQPLFKLIMLTLQKDASGKLFQKTAAAALECQDMAFTRFQVTDFLSMLRHQKILSAMHGNSLHASTEAAILDFIKSNENTFLEMQALRKKITLLMNPMDKQQVELDKLVKMPLGDLKELHKSGSYSLSHEYARACILSSEENETIYEVHDIACKNGKLSDECFTAILSNTLEMYGGVYSNIKLDSLQFIQYADDHRVKYSAEKLCNPDNYFDQLTIQYKNAVRNDDSKKARLYMARIDEDLTQLSDEYLDRSFESLKKEIPVAIFNQNNRIRKYEISNDFEI